MAVLLFFIAVTPFEMAQSGIVYIVKAIAMLLIAAYAVVVRRARIGQFSILVFIVLAMLLVTNLFGWSDRVLIAMLTIFSGALLGQIKGAVWTEEVKVVVFLYLLVNFVGLAVAASLFYSVGYIADLHQMVFPHESRIEAYGVVGRLSGFHNEPGTYSQWMTMVLYLSCLMQRRFFSIWHGLFALSILATFSLWGSLAFVVMVVAFAMDSAAFKGVQRTIRNLLSFVLFIGVLTLVISNISSEIIDTGFEFFNQKGSLSTPSGLDKLYASNFFLDELSGILAVGRPFEPGFCPACISPQDAGLGMTGSYYLGVIVFTGLMVALAIKIYSRWGVSFLLPLVMLLVWKAHIYEPLLWVVIGYILKGSGGIFPGGEVRRAVPSCEPRST